MGPLCPLLGLKPNRKYYSSITMETNLSDCIDHGKVSHDNGYYKKRYRGRNRFKHRLVYCETHGLEIEQIDGMVVRHTCDNRRCINPDHLLLGTTQDNMNDMARRRRHGKIKLTIEQVHEIRSTCKPGRRGIRGNPFSYSALGKKFQIASMTIRKVYLGINHKFV